MLTKCVGPIQEGTAAVDGSALSFTVQIVYLFLMLGLRLDDNAFYYY